MPWLIHLFVRKVIFRKITLHSMSENKKDTLLCVFVRISVRNKLKNVRLTSFKMQPSSVKFVNTWKREGIVSDHAVGWR